MATSLRMRRAVYEALRTHHLQPGSKAERLSYVFGTSFVDAGGNTVVIVADPPVLLGDDCYFRQGGGHVSLHEDVRDGIMIKFAQSDHDTLIDVHDHWFAEANTRFSPIDDADDRARARYIHGKLEPALATLPGLGRARTLLTVSIVFDQQGYDARVIDRHGRFSPIDRIDLIGISPQSLVPNGAPQPTAMRDETHARHDAFIDTEAMAMLGRLRFGVVGCGGLGSIAAEGLYRLGARKFVLIDDDRLDATNLNRWQGGRVREIGRNKARLLSRRLRSFDADTLEITTVSRSVLDPAVEADLRHCDVVIGCVDNDVARHFLNRFAVQYLTPLFDAGVNIRAGNAVDFESRFYCVIPGATACLECTSYDLVDHHRLSLDLMDEVTSAARREAGYVEDHPEIRSAPSAYALNLSAVSTLLTEFTNWLCGYRPVATCSYRSWRAALEQRSDRDNHGELPSPACPVCGTLLGAGPYASLPRPLLSGEAAKLLLEAQEGSALGRAAALRKEAQHG